MNYVNWFEIPASDLSRAQKFYEKVMGKDIRCLDADDNHVGTAKLIPECIVFNAERIIFVEHGFGLYFPVGAI